MSDQKFTRTCNVDGCDRKHEAKGYCPKHYSKYRRHGDPLAGTNINNGDPLKWILQLVENPITDECIIWPFANNKDGYGNVGFNGKTHRANRLTLTLFAGEPPTRAHQAAHSCGKGYTGCVNPLHLYWATPAENAKDRIAHGTSGHKLTEKEAVQIYHDNRPYRLIAAERGISKSTVGNVKCGMFYSRPSVK